MRKIFIMLTLCLLMVPVGIVSAAPATNEVMSTWGTITNIRDNTVTVEGTGSFSTIILTSSDQSHIRDGITGARLELSALEVGMPVTVYYTPVMTRSNPPQTKPLAIITGNSPDIAKYIIVGSVEHFANESRVLDVNQAQLITIKDSVFPYPSSIIVGQELLLWYPFITMSLPGQATAVKAMHIYHDEIDINVSLQAGVAAVRGQEIQLTKHAFNTPGTIYLPVRAISEALGYNVDWNSTNQTVIVKNVVFPVALSVGSTVYQRDDQTITLVHPPIIADGTMLAPIDFFTNVLGATVYINNNHV